MIIIEFKVENESVPGIQEIRLISGVVRNVIAF